MATSNGCVEVVQQDPPVRNSNAEDKAVQPVAKRDKSVKANKRLTGTVKWFNVKDGFGFITRHDTGEDVFVHESCILRPNSRHSVRSVGDGEVVEFGLIASKVTGPGFKRVKGSAFVRPKRFGGGGGGGVRGRPKSESASERSKQREERRDTKNDHGTTNNPSVVGDGPEMAIVKEMALLKIQEKEKEEEQNTTFELSESTVDPIMQEPNDDTENDEDDDDDTASADSTSTVATVESAD